MTVRLLRLPPDVAREPASVGDTSGLIFVSRYRRHPGISAEECLSIREAHIREMLASACVAAVVKDGCCHALLAIQMLDWESAHFSMPMAGFSLLSAPSADPFEGRRLISAALADFKAATGCKHYSAEVDIDDYQALRRPPAFEYHSALESGVNLAGFRASC